MPPLVDAQVIARRLLILNDALDQLSSRASTIDEMSLRGDALLRAATERWLQEAIEACVDLAYHVIVDSGWIPVETARSAFVRLADHQLISAELAARPGLRLPIVRSFRAPHHSCSEAALVDGGHPIRPGEVTLAHGGVLFLDELPEFRRNVIEALRPTMESGRAVVVRARERVNMPAKRLVVAATNPCPCGLHRRDR